MAEILYADDDELLREVVSSELTARGNTVRLVSNGTQAMEELRRSRPDLILLDYRMGEPDGFAVTREIKSDPRFGHIPVLILTAEGAIDDRLAGFDAGADDYLAKPFDARELSARVRALLELSRRGLDRNPSSGLPGGDAIRREFGHRCRAGKPFAICYLDLDNFKPFGDRFGFPVSDAVIRDVGDVLQRIAQESNAFVGHVGGDDFVLLCESADARHHVERVQRLLVERLPNHLPSEIVHAGKYVGKDRAGVTKEFPLTAISVAILHLPANYPASLQELGETVAQYKERAKREGSGGIVEVDLAIS
jgi:PleD family two-component response regulator